MKVNRHGLLAALLWATGACAAEIPLVKALEPCRPDVEKFCSAVEPGGGRIVGCLQRHRNELAPVCKSRLAQYRGKPKSGPTWVVWEPAR